MQHPQRPGAGDARRDLGADGVLDEARRPGRAADLAAHLDVLDRVGDPARVDVGELPEGLVRAGARCSRRTAPASPSDMPGTVRAHRSARPASTGLVGLGQPARQVHRHEGRQPVQVRLAALAVLGALEDLQEVVVEEEDPHVPVGDQVELGAVAVRDGCTRTAARSRGRRGRAPPRCRSPPASPSVRPLLGVPRASSTCGLSRAGYGT